MKYFQVSIKIIHCGTSVGANLLYVFDCVENKWVNHKCEYWIPSGGCMQNKIDGGFKLPMEDNNKDDCIDDLIVDDFCANVAQKIQSAKKDDNNHEKEDRFL